MNRPHVALHFLKVLRAFSMNSYHEQHVVNDLDCRANGDLLLTHSSGHELFVDNWSFLHFHVVSSLFSKMQISRTAAYGESFTVQIISKLTEMRQTIAALEMSTIITPARLMFRKYTNTLSSNLLIYEWGFRDLKLCVTSHGQHAFQVPWSISHLDKINWWDNKRYYSALSGFAKNSSGISLLPIPFVM